MYVKEIWRYPVKSMGGERLRSARLTESGIDGDRIIQVRNTRGRFVTSRTAPELLRFTGCRGPIPPSPPRWKKRRVREAGWSAMKA
jgi:uncharacterized protein YcbX